MDDYRDSLSGPGALGIVRTKGELSGVIEVDGDLDVFRTTIIDGLSYEIEVRAVGDGGGTLPEGLFEVYDRNGGYEGFGFMDGGPFPLDAEYTGYLFILPHNGGSGGTGSYTVLVTEGTATDASETITGSADGDGVDGAGGNDLIDGRGGADSLFGGAGDDTLLGGVGDDLLNGYAGRDILRGQAGSDLLIGRAQADTLVGGSGGDTFRFDYATDSAPGQRDVLKAGDGGAAFDGVGSAAGDIINLAMIDADATKSGNQKFAFGGAEKGHLSLVDVGADTVVRGNTDGDSAFEFQVLIQDGSGVQSSDYRLADFVL
jgi:Ca2+-binding RTX toxin-like protein